MFDNVFFCNNSIEVHNAMNSTLSLGHRMGTTQMCELAVSFVGRRSESTYPTLHCSRPQVVSACIALLDPTSNLGKSSLSNELGQMTQNCFDEKEMTKYYDQPSSLRQIFESTIKESKNQERINVLLCCGGGQAQQTLGWYGCCC